jgi:thioredoxin 1
MKQFQKYAMLLTVLFSMQTLAEFKTYSKEVYDSAIKAGDTIILDFYASWCPTCKKQHPLLNEIVNMKGYEKVVALKADYDTEKDLKKNLKVSKQSTIVVFKSGKEVGRSTGVTSKDDLKKLIDMGL